MRGFPRKGPTHGSASHGAAGTHATPQNNHPHPAPVAPNLSVVNKQPVSAPPPKPHPETATKKSGGKAKHLGWLAPALTYVGEEFAKKVLDKELEANVPSILKHFHHSSEGAESEASTSAQQDAKASDASKQSQSAGTENVRSKDELEFPPDFSTSHVVQVPCINGAKTEYLSYCLFKSVNRRTQQPVLTFVDQASVSQGSFGQITAGTTVKSSIDKSWLWGHLSHQDVRFVVHQPVQALMLYDTAFLTQLLVIPEVNDTHAGWLTRFDGP